MREILVTSAAIKAKAAELQQTNGQLKGEIQTLKDQEAALKAEFVGEASSAFHSAFQTDMAQMEKFMTEIDHYAQSLEQIAAHYEQAEQANVSTAAARSYQ